jgi:putative ABC transport system ATP-binding protein
VFTKVINVTKTYGFGSTRVKALNGISLDINEGDYIALLGPSGSGKTTLLSIIGCLIHPSSGEVYYDKHKVRDLSEKELSELRSRDIGFVFQFTDLLPNLTVLENVMTPMLFQSADRKETEKKACELLKRLGLGHCLDARPRTISGGERQRVAIARALINKPRMLLADEPTGDLDDETSKKIIELFSEHNKAGTTIILVTHNREFAHAAGNVYEMREGRIQRILK